MLENIKLEDILFLDIETVPLHSDYNKLDNDWKELWDKKAKRISNSDEDTPESIYNRAGIYAEFGRIVCISVGVIYEKNQEKHIREKSFAHANEQILLARFADMVNSLNKKRPGLILCGHNAKEFDIPFIARRMLVNGLKLPTAINIAGKKPWEINHLDTMELWKFGDYKSYTSLNLLTKLFGIPTPKDDIDGSEVYKVYYEDNDLDRIVNYCQKDVVALIQLFCKYQGLDLIPPDNVEVTN